jgi:hypothetical protein
MLFYSCVEPSRLANITKRQLTVQAIIGFTVNLAFCKSLDGVKAGYQCIQALPIRDFVYLCQQMSPTILEIVLNISQSCSKADR